MTEPIERRRAMLALGAGLATTAIPVLAPTESARASRTAGTNRSRSQIGKQTVDIPKDNPIYGVSSSAFEKYGYSPAVRAGGLLFIAGVVGVRPDGSVPDSVAEQSELVFRRTAEILSMENLTMADLVEVVSYHVDIENNLKEFIPTKERYFERPFPTWTIIGVEALARSSLKIEVRSIAALRI